MEVAQNSCVAARRESSSVRQGVGESRAAKLGEYSSKLTQDGQAYCMISRKISLPKRPVTVVVPSRRHMMWQLHW